MRLCYLYLRSRLSGWTVGGLAVIGVICWLWLRQAHAIHLMEVALLIVPLMTSAVIGASTRSPFGDTESSVSYPLPILRFSHLAGLLICATAVLGLSTYGWDGESISVEFVRNLAGFTGLALLGARFLGSGICWIIPLGYGVISLMVESRSRLAWPREIPADHWSLFVAVTLMVVGLFVVVFRQSRPVGDDPDA